MSPKKIYILRICTVSAGAAFVCMGIFRSEVTEVLNKAVKICLECIGIG